MRKVDLIVEFDEHYPVLVQVIIYLLQHQQSLLRGFVILFKENHSQVGFGSNELVKYVVGNLKKSTIKYNRLTQGRKKMLFMTISQKVRPDLLDISPGKQIVDPCENFPRLLQFSVINTGDLILEKLQCRKLINIVLGSQGFVLMMFSNILVDLYRRDPTLTQTNTMSMLSQSSSIVSITSRILHCKSTIRAEI